MAILRRLDQPYKASASVNEHLVIVPGISSDQVADQTCPHFEPWIDACCKKPKIVWVFDHGLDLRFLKDWNALCTTIPESLLKELLATCTVPYTTSDQLFSVANKFQKPDCTVSLIGHKLGVFILKRALTLAHDSKHRPDIKALFKITTNILMIGDPDLRDGNETNWLQQVLDCLPTAHRGAREKNLQANLRSLKSIADEFDNGVDIPSTFFQVDGQKPDRSRWNFKSKRVHVYGCVCNASIVVRVWGTADLDKDFWLDDDNNSNCVFHPKHTYNEELQRITNNEYPAQILQLHYANTSGTIINQTNLRRLGGAPANTSEGQEEIVDSAGGLSRIDTLETKASEASEYLTEGISAATTTEIQQFANVDLPTRVIEEVMTTTPLREENLAYRDNHGVASVPTFDDVVPRLPPDDDLMNHFHNNVKPATEAIEGFPTPSTSNATPRLCEDKSHMGSVSGPTLHPPVTSSASEQSASLAQCDMCIPPKAGLHKHKFPKRSRRLALQLNFPPLAEPFVGREEALAALNSGLGEVTKLDSTTNVTVQRVAFLHGAAGIGKTTVAREFVNRAGANFDCVFWIQSRTQRSIRRSVHEAAISLGLIPGRENLSHSESKDKFDSWLAQTDLSWLLVFDDADDVALISAHLPTYARGHIIITSRDANICLLERANRAIIDIAVPELSSSEASTLLSLLLEQGGGQQRNLDAEALEEFLDQTGCHPLVLKMMSAHLESEDETSQGENLLSSFHRALRQWKDDDTIVGLGASPLLPGAVLANLHELSPEAYDWVALCSVLDSYNVHDNITLEGQNCGSLPLQNFPMDEANFRSAKRKSIRWRIVSSSSKSAVQIDRVSGACLRYRMPLHEKRVVIFTACALLCAQWPTQDQLESRMYGFWPEFDNLYGHVDALARSTYDVLQNMRPEDASMFSPEMRNKLAVLLLRTTWYNKIIRKNAHEGTNMIRLAQFLLSMNARQREAAQEGEVSAPRRLVEINEKDQTWRLIEYPKSKVSYCAVSHLWDEDTKLFMLTAESRESFLAGQKLTDGPSLLRDVASTMISLGLKYLWIDAMCILQSDEKDWAEQATSMASIYSNSAITIAVNSQPRELKSNSQSMSDAPVDSVWNSRGWVFQERLLSPHVLHFETNSMVWECKELSSWLLVAWDVPGLACITSSVHIACRVESGELNMAASPQTHDLIHQRHQPGDDADALVRASDVAEIGVQCFRRSNFALAALKFVKARDIISAIPKSFNERRWVYLHYSIYLAISALRQNFPEDARDFIHTGLQMTVAEPEQVNQRSSEILGRAYMTLGDIDSSIGDIKSAATNFDEAATIVTDVTTDLFHVVQIKRASIFVASKQYSQAQSLIDAAVKHFEIQESSTGQAQHIRALHMKACAYKAADKKRLHSITLGQAQTAFTYFCEESGENTPNPTVLSMESLLPYLPIGYQ